jgi:hypothetical protein
MSETKDTYTNLTAGEIVEYLKDLPKDTEIHIEGFTFYRWKWRGDNLLQLELNEAEED